MVNLTKVNRYLSRRVQRSQDQVKRYAEYNSKEHTFHGGWSKGYAEGRLSASQDIQDMIEDGLLNG